MYTIRQVTSAARQKQNIVLADGSTIGLTISFRSLQLGWFIDELVYQSFTLRGVRISNSPNMLHQFRYQIPFGLACYSVANREPMQAEDFSSGASRLYVTDAAEVEAFAEYLRGG